MSSASFSIKNPILIASIVIIIVVMGILSIQKLGVDMYPDVEMPFISVTTIYQGASPEEVEEQISKPIEGEISSIAGLSKIHSESYEGYSVVWGEFTLDSDAKYCEQQVRNKIDRIRKYFPEGTEQPSIERYDMSRDPIAFLALQSDLDDGKLYDIAKDTIKPAFEQISGVGTVTISGGSQREIQIELDRNKLNQYKIPASYVVERLKTSGVNVPVGKNDAGYREMVFRSVGQFKSVSEIENSVILFSGDANNSVTLRSLGTVRDGIEDKYTLGYLFDRDIMKKTGEKKSYSSVFILVYKQSGSNTVKVVDLVAKKIETMNKKLASMPSSPKLILTGDNARFIKVNVDDVKSSIFLGILFAMIIVYLFLGNLRSTFITGIAIPNSLLGGFVLMYVMGFTINVMSLMALSLTVGLLIDDAIVVRENIFRKLEQKMHPDEAAVKGTNEVMMAVIATTITIIAVFFPIAFMEGIVGRFFKQFGLTIVFAMIVSLFDALTVAPFLSAYFSGKPHQKLNVIIATFERFQSFLDRIYSFLLKKVIKHWLITVIIAVVIFGISMVAGGLFVKKAFLPPLDDRNFKITFELPSGSSLAATLDVSRKMEKVIQNVNELQRYSMFVGEGESKPNKTTLHITLVPESERKRTNEAIKIALRKEINKLFPDYKPVVAEYSIGGNLPYALDIEGNDLDEMNEYAKKLIVEIRKIPDLADVQSLYEGGKPEFQVVLDQEKMARLGITPGMAGTELRYHVAGADVGKLHDRGNEYDVKLRLRKDQRDMKKYYAETKIPNINGMMVPLPAISHIVEKTTPNQIIRENRKRIIRITANIAPKGALGEAVEKTYRVTKGTLKPPVGMTATVVGESEDMEDLGKNIAMAMILSVIIIYLVLASLYGSFITPITILIALPPAISGAFFALAIFGKTLDMFSQIGLVMLMGLVVKNSILLVDYAVKGVANGMPRKEAIYAAGMTRLRPILMTTFAMIAGTLPIALGIGEAARGRMSMGIAILGGMVLSTMLTLLVVPAIFSFMDRLREFIHSPFTLERAKKRFGFIDKTKKK
jgi:HAE1 family hydrophobic/amphiphilic exporter-1